jgi:release factor glutamine methyltransferase
VAGAERPWHELTDATPDEDELACFEAMVARRADGEPLQYVMGHWPFRSLELLVDGRALIPRPETEQVAEVALAELDALGVDAPVVVDLGTGTGALALSIAVERPTAWVLGVDASQPALELAMENRDRVGLGVKRVALASGSWFAKLPDGLRGAVDLIVTNPPYVATDDEIDDTVRAWEPLDALFAGDDGLDDLLVIIAHSPDWLAPHGVLVAEIGATQADAVMALAREAGFAHAEVRPDLAGRDRILVARRQ